MKANSKSQIKGQISFIEQKLNKIGIEKLSKDCDFSKRKAKKISAKDFLLGFFLMAKNRENHSYRNWAIKIGWIIKDRVSKQALWKKMRQAQIIFLKKVLSAIINETMNIANDYPKLKSFRNVIVEDSTAIGLNDKLYKDYPGNGYWDKKAKKAIMKIQAAYNITSRRLLRLDVSSFRDNDQGYSANIVQILKRGDLIIRDLGYFVLKVFKELNKDGIFYISRMKKHVNIFLKKDEPAIDLAKMLKKRGTLDIEVFLGEKEKLPVRLVALPVKEEIANERRRKAKTNRDKRCSPNKEHLYLLGWELFITNVGKEVLSPKDIAELYFIRWRIETIFKSWKSYFKITQIPKDANKIRVESFIYCMLIFIVLFQVHFYNYYLSKLKSRALQTEEISLLRLMQFMISNIDIVLQPYSTDSWSNEQLIFDQINYYCQYESRKDRVNFSQQLRKLG